MKYGIGLLTVIAMTACSKPGATPEPASQVNVESAPATINGLEYKRGGWFTSSDSLRGIVIQVAIDVSGQKFTLNTIENYETGDVSCPAVTFAAADYRDLVANLEPLHQVKRSETTIIDAGIATMEIKDSSGARVQWILDSSDANSSKLPVLAGAGKLEAQLNALSRKIACPAPVRQIVLERSGQFTAPGSPSRNLVRVNVDHAHQTIKYSTYSEFADGPAVYCEVTAGADQYALITQNLADVEEITPSSDSRFIDAGVAELTLVSGRQYAHSTLQNSDSYDPNRPVVAAFELETQLYGYVRACLQANPR